MEENGVVWAVVTVREAALICGVTRQTVHAWVDGHKVAFRRLSESGIIIIDRASLAEHNEKRKAHVKR